MHEAVSSFLPGNDVCIKWPNDILVSRQKVCGILCESRGPVTAVGIGMNVNQLVWPDDLEGSATSLAQVAKKPYELTHIIKQAVYCLDHWFALFAQKGFGPVRLRFLEYGLLKGYKVLTDEGIQCSIVDLNMEGHLLINVSGRLKTLSTGSIHVV